MKSFETWRNCAPPVRLSAALAATVLTLAACGGADETAQVSPGKPLLAALSSPACNNRVNNTFSKLLECMTVEGVRGHQAALQAIAQRPTQREHQRGLAAADRATDPDRERARGKVAAQWGIALVEPTGVVPVLVMMMVIVVFRVVTHGGS